jgi:hypothetical protein
VGRWPGLELELDAGCWMLDAGAGSRELGAGSWEPGAGRAVLWRPSVSISERGRLTHIDSKLVLSRRRVRAGHWMWREGLSLASSSVCVVFSGAVAVCSRECASSVLCNSPC